MSRFSHRRNQKRAALIICLGLILCIAVGTTLAYLFTGTPTLQNLFTGTYVTCRVNVSATDDSVDVTNTGNIPAYIRAAITVNWEDANGNVRGIAPKASEYTLTLNETEWSKVGEFWYYSGVVAALGDPGDTTEDLVKAVALTDTAPEGYELVVHVAAEAIQAEGMGASSAVEAWQLAPNK